MNKIINILNNVRSINAVSKDTNITISLPSTQTLLPYNYLTKFINEYKIFQGERETSKNYRIICTIREVVSNCLLSVSGEDNFITKINNNYNNINGFIYGLQNDIRERDGWFGLENTDFDSESYLGIELFEPKPFRFNVLADAWDVLVTYPHSTDNQHYLVNGGLLIIGRTETEISNRKYLVLRTATKHGLTVDDKIRLFNTPIDGEYTVVDLGLGDGKYKDYCFIIDVRPNELPSISINWNGRLKRIVKDVESEYYIRKFKKIENIPYEKFKLGYCQTIYGDDVSQIIFDDILIDKYKDNLGRPLSELYITLIKSDGYCDGVKSGIYIPHIEGLDVPISNILDGSLLSPNGFIPQSTDMVLLPEGFVNSGSSGIPGTLVPPVIEIDSNIALSDNIGTPNNIGGATNFSVANPLTNSIDKLPNINKIHDILDDFNNYPEGFIPPNSCHYFEKNITKDQDYFYGDIVEYNGITLREYVLADVYHRFNLKNRNETIGGTGVINYGPRPEGYFYKTHNKILIRQYSNFISESKDGDIIPEYATYLGGDKYIWREQLPLGLNDGGYAEPLDYPFLNGSHYVYVDFNLKLRRQDPFNVHGLRFDLFPSDVQGMSITTNEFDFKDGGDVC